MTGATQTLDGTYNLFLVALSIVIAVIASYVALDLAGRVTASTGRARKIWLAGGAAAMGGGIWSMHFIGMLAYSITVADHLRPPDRGSLAGGGGGRRRVRALYLVSRETTG